VFEKRMLRRTFGPKREKITGGCTNDKYVHNFSPFTSRNTPFGKPRR
jgi:hypothetical protein